MNQLPLRTGIRNPKPSAICISLGIAADFGDHHGEIAPVVDGVRMRSSCGGAAYLLRGVLYGVNTVDGISFVGVSLLFLTIALLAAYPPSRRAMRVGPIVALRYE